MYTRGDATLGDRYATDFTMSITSLALSQLTRRLLRLLLLRFNPCRNSEYDHFNSVGASHASQDPAFTGMARHLVEEYVTVVMCVKLRWFLCRIAHSLRFSHISSFLRRFGRCFVSHVSVHPMFRNGFNRLLQQGTARKDGPGVDVTAFRTLNDDLHAHHGGEDKEWFPKLRTAHPECVRLPILDPHREHIYLNNCNNCHTFVPAFFFSSFAIDIY